MKKNIVIVGKITEKMDFQFSYGLPDAPTPASSGQNMVAIFYLLALLVSIFICYRIYQYNPDHQLYEGDMEYDTIGGWLFLIAIGLLSAPIFIVIDMIERSYFSAVLWESTSFSSMSGILFLIDSALDLFIISTVILLCYLFYTRRTSFPRLFIIFMALLFAYNILECFAAHYAIGTRNEGDTLFSLVRIIIYSAIWIPYTLYSKRVKGTFIYSIR